MYEVEQLVFIMTIVQYDEVEQLVLIITTVLCRWSAWRPRGAAPRCAARCGARG